MGVYQKFRITLDHSINVQILYQDNPFQKCTYIPKDKEGSPCKNRSFTNSIESYQNGASKETSILRWNKRIPMKEIVLHLLKELSAENINMYREKVFRYLKEHGIEGVASIELTRGADRKANNCVHFHILTDDLRSEDEIRSICNRACERDGFKRGINFRIDFRSLYDGESYFYYFTKFGYPEKVILFKPRLLKSGGGLQKFYQIGRWFKKTKSLLWEEIKNYMREKDGSDPDRIDGKDEVDLPNITEDGLSNEPVEDKVANETASDRFVWLQYRHGYIPIDKRLLIPDLTYYPDIDFDCLLPERLPDRRQDWKRFKYNVAFLQ